MIYTYSLILLLFISINNIFCMEKQTDGVEQIYHNLNNTDQKKRVEGLKQLLQLPAEMHKINIIKTDGKSLIYQGKLHDAVNKAVLKNLNNLPIKDFVLDNKQQQTLFDTGNFVFDDKLIADLPGLPPMRLIIGRNSVPQKSEYEDLDIPDSYLAAFYGEIITKY